MRLRPRCAIGQYLILIEMAAASIAQARDLVIVRDGKPQATIVVAKANLGMESKAATAAADLQAYIKKMSGATLPIVADDQPPEGARILVGRSRATELSKLDIPRGETPARREEGFVIACQGDNLLLAGNDEGLYHGSEYAVYDFLERLGVRWFMPGEYGEVVPARSTITVGETTIRGRPDFVMRNWWNHALADLKKLDDRWKLRNKLNPESQYLFATPGDGSARALLSADHFKAHPEAFAMNVDGSRNPYLPNFTHPKAVELSARTIKDAMRKDPKVTSYGFAPDDGIPRDYAPETLARNRGFPEVYGRPGVEAEKSVSEEWIEFANNVAREVRKEFPQAYIATNGYANRNTPPQGVKIDDHMVIMFAAIWSDTLHPYTDPKSWMATREGRMLKTWAEACPNVWVYNYDYVMLVSGLTPVPRVSKVRVDYPLMKQWGVIGFYNEARNVWAEEGIATKYIRAKLMWDTSADVDALLAGFYSQWYGAAARPSRAFWDALEKAVQETPMLGHEDRILPFVYSPALIEQLEYSLALAEKMADTDRVKAHVRADRLILQHLKTYLTMQDAEFAGDFGGAVRAGRRMMDLRKELSAIHPVYVLGHEERYHSGIYYWGVEDRIKYYQTLDENLTGKTGRLVALLPGTARFNLDRHDDGRFGNWYATDFDDSRWRTIKTTEPFYRQGFMDSLGHIYLGNMWYRFSVDVPASAAGKPVRIYAPTVETEAWCWVNGRFVGYRKFRDAYERPNEMEFDVTAAVRPGQKNTVAIRVNTGLNASMAASGLLSRVFLYSPVQSK